MVCRTFESTGELGTQERLNEWSFLLLLSQFSYLCSPAPDPSWMIGSLMELTLVIICYDCAHTLPLSRLPD